MLKQYILLSVQIFFDVLSFVIIAKVLLSWINIDRHHPVYVFLNDITSPILNLAARITPKTGILDLSPVIALIGLHLLENILLALLQ